MAYLTVSALVILLQFVAIGVLWRNWRRTARTEAETLQRCAELEQRVQQRSRQLELTNKELETFCYAVSHDLRAPLRGIDGWSLALEEDCSAQLDQTARQYLGLVRSEARRMEQLFEALLSLSRVTRGELVPQRVDLSSLAQSIAQQMTRAQSSRQIDFLIEPGLSALGDPRMLEVALTHLFDNACKFTVARPVAKIEFFGRLETGGTSPVFCVRDNGVGFDMAYAQKLFGAFQRMHQVSEFPGVGIGLATVQRIVHAHGGRIWAEAQVGQGASFNFTLDARAKD